MSNLVITPSLSIVGQPNRTVTVVAETGQIVVSGGRIKADHQLDVRLRLSGDANAIVFVTDRQKVASAISAVSTSADTYYQKMVPLICRRSIYRRITNPDRIIRIAEVDGSMLRIHQVAVVVQFHQLFLVNEVQYEVPLYRGTTGVVSAAWLNWPSLLELIQPLVDASQLPAYQENSRPTPDTSGLGANEGIVIWYDPAVGLGAIALPGGNAVVTAKQLRNRKSGQLTRLYAGQTVTFGACLPNKRKNDFTYVVRTVAPQVLAAA